jgi:three-Cys-motif partner protein
MREKWASRIYAEPYAGAGYSRIRGTSKLIAGSPIRALSLKQPFDKYIFCEELPEKLAALEVRANRHAPNAKVKYVEGDCNLRVGDIIEAIPHGSVLTLCFADPFDIGLRFESAHSPAHDASIS